MIQRERQHQPGTFAPCANCGREPKHYEVSGYSTRDIDSPRDAAGVAHMLECYRCGRSTARYALLTDALHDWVGHHAQSNLGPQPRGVPLSHLRAIQ